MLPFTPEQFLSVFVNYNTAIWPNTGRGRSPRSLGIVLLLWKALHADRITAAILATMWFAGIAYHGVFFER